MVDKSEVAVEVNAGSGAWSEVDIVDCDWIALASFAGVETVAIVETVTMVETVSSIVEAVMEISDTEELSLVSVILCAFACEELSFVLLLFRLTGEEAASDTERDLSELLLGEALGDVNELALWIPIFEAGLTLPLHL